MDRMISFRTRSILALLAGIASTAGAQGKEAREMKTVVFVCEHGTAKSVIAMAYFEKLAREAGLPFRAISRGTSPDTVLPQFMLEGLKHDRLDVGAFTPKALGDEDLLSATLVVSFDQPTVAERTRGPLQQWNGLPAVSVDYASGSEAIKQRVAHLIDSLAKARRR